MEDADDGNTDGDERESKRRHMNSVSPANDSIDATVLHFQNQKLVQQLDVQKNQVQDLEQNLDTLGEKQKAYNNSLIRLNRMWNQLVEDLALLGLRCAGSEKFLDVLDPSDPMRGLATKCPPEEIFLHRLLQRVSYDDSEGDKNGRLESFLSARCLSTKELMKSLTQIIELWRTKTERLSILLKEKLSSEDAVIHACEINDSISEEARCLQKVIDSINAKHVMYEEEMQDYVERLSRDQSEIKQLSGELDEKMAELEESRRKLVNLRMQKEGSSALHSPVSMSNGNSMSDKSSDQNVGLQELKDSIEAAKTLAAVRLSELQEAKDANLILLERVQGLQKDLEDDKYVLSSKAYTLLSDHLHRLNSELERHKSSTDTLQADRNNVLQKEEELRLKVESADALQKALSEIEVKMEDLELQVKRCTSEKNDAELKMEEAEQDMGRKDIKAEFQVMSSALSKEMGMVETQLNRCEEIAQEAASLRSEADILKVELDDKVEECKNISDRCKEQESEIKSLKELIEKLEKEKQELQSFLDMYGQQCLDSRDLTEIKDSERRAQAQSEVLKRALDEHSLELRVRAANEAEAACQLRLAAAEKEIADLWSKLDASERLGPSLKAIEINEAIKIKDGEAETYMTEIETIGQAYEDMQTQNQHLLQQVTERDDYNIKLVSESVKIKQAQSSLLFEKQVLYKQLQQINSSLDLLNVKIARGEEQAHTLFPHAKKTVAENRVLSIDLESSKQELMDAEKDLKWLRSAVDSSEKEFEQTQQKLLELQEELDTERNETKKLEQEHVEITRQVAELSPEGRNALIQKLEDEIKDCKAILKCGVCFDRPKEVVITKCYHLFCNPCIQRNLEIRHRKCPGCGTPFGQNDVKQVNI